MRFTSENKCINQEHRIVTGNAEEAYKCATILPWVRTIAQGSLNKASNRSRLLIPTVDASTCLSLFPKDDTSASM